MYGYYIEVIAHMMDLHELNEAAKKQMAAWVLAGTTTQANYNRFVDTCNKQDKALEQLFDRAIQTRKYPVFILN